ncbi:MAG: glutamate-1-semialdehyde 2,1-aminomutase [Candidatus Omnitrophica bacterium]|nr:glutamate-1-semialdehyde 2,1-aminomutase [Candidatus Omnitrophota bacterium]
MAKSINKKLFNKAQQYLVGGVDSPVRAFGYVGGDPLLIRRGQGSLVFDYDQRAYIDYVLSWGALILGHAHPLVVRDVKQALSHGFSFGTTNAQEIALAKVIHDAIPAVQKLRFVNSGSEAVMGALRLARGFTGRNKIVKFAHSYHGHADYLLANAGSGLATLSLPASKGVPRHYLADTIVAPLGDKTYLTRIFRKYKNAIAAVIIEPAGGNYGVIPPDLDFLRFLRKITRRHGALLVADEVITGFRIHYGSLLASYGITADLLCLGKIIGGGLPVGAFGGHASIMDHLAPVGPVYQASTFSGNPVVMQAGLSTLTVLKRLQARYSRLAQLTEYLANAIDEQARLQAIELTATSFGSMFSVQLKKQKQFAGFYRYLLAHGVYFAPSAFEANFLSFAHTDHDVEKTIKLAVSAFSSSALR